MSQEGLWHTIYLKGTQLQADQFDPVDHSLALTIWAAAGDLSPPHTCTICSGLLLDLASVTIWDLHTREYLVLESEYFEPPAEDLTAGAARVQGAIICVIPGKDVEAGAEGDCHFLKWCRDLYVRGRALLPLGDSELLLRAHGPEFPRITTPDGYVTRIQLDYRHRDDRPNHLDLTGALTTCGIRTKQCVPYTLVDRRVENFAADFIPFHFVESDLMKVGAVNLCVSWLITCLAEHGDSCGQALSDFVPSLLVELELNEQGELFCKLVTREEVQQRGRRLPYVALSYCWGRAGNLKTTMATFEAFRRRIDVVLPKTIENAVELTHCFGVKYIWIDALCIVQDAPDSVKAKDIGSMDQIYQHAVLTISAASAAAVQEGFLVARPPKLTSGFQLNLRAPDGRISPVVLVEQGLFFDTMFKNAADDLTDPVDSRAWTLQETLLSKRVLSFSRVGMYWECHCAHWAENMSTAIMPANHIVEFRRENCMQLGPEEIKRLHTNWQEFISSYTRRGISVHTDRLPALSGLVKWMSSFVNDTYKAGFWRSSLLHDLLWFRNTRAHPSNVGQQQLGLSLRDDLETPTWSWASVGGISIPVDFAGPPTQPAIAPGLTFRAEIIGVDVESLYNDDPYGRVKRGSLCISGRLQEARWTSQDRSQVRSLDGNFVFDAYPDTLPHLVERNQFGDRLWCLEVAENDGYKLIGEAPLGLLLVAKPDGEYKRIGAFGRMNVSRYAQEYEKIGLRPIIPLEEQEILQRNEDALAAAHPGEIPQLEDVVSSGVILRPIIPAQEPPDQSRIFDDSPSGMSPDRRNIVQTESQRVPEDGVQSNASHHDKTQFDEHVLPKENVGSQPSQQDGSQPQQHLAPEMQAHQDDESDPWAHYDPYHDMNETIMEKFARMMNEPDDSPEKQAWDKYRERRRQRPVTSPLQTRITYEIVSPALEWFKAVEPCVVTIV